MDTEEVRKELEERVNELQSYVTSEMFEKASEEEKERYIKLIAEIRTKLEILKVL